MSKEEDKLLAKIDEALSPPVKDVLSGEWCRQEHPDVKHWVRAGVESDGGVRLVGQAAGLDAVGGEIRRGARVRETELPEPTHEHLKKFYGGAIQRGDTRVLEMIGGLGPPAPAQLPPKKRSRIAKRKRSGH